MNDIELYAKLNGRLYRLVPVPEGKKALKAVRNCIQCGKPFIPKRKTKKYCGSNCRVAACRARKEVL